MIYTKIVAFIGLGCPRGMQQKPLRAYCLIVPLSLTSVNHSVGTKLNTASPTLVGSQVHTWDSNSFESFLLDSGENERENVGCFCAYDSRRGCWLPRRSDSDSGRCTSCKPVPTSVRFRTNVSAPVRNASSRGLPNRL
jgi:hypothetical protein